MNVISIFDPGGPSPQTLILAAFLAHLKGEEARRSPDLSVRFLDPMGSQTGRKISA